MLLAMSLYVLSVTIKRELILMSSIYRATRVPNVSAMSSYADTIREVESYVNNRDSISNCFSGIYFRTIGETMKFKKEAIKSGWLCPHCNVESVEAEGIPQVHGLTVTLEMVCLEESCSKKWTEIYTLSDLIDGMVS